MNSFVSAVLALSAGLTSLPRNASVDKLDKLDKPAAKTNEFRVRVKSERGLRVDNLNLSCWFNACS